MSQNRLETGFKARAAIHVILVVGCVVMIGPFIWMILTSFKTLGEATHIPIIIFPKNWKFNNYIKATSTLTFGYYYFNTIVMAVGRVAGQLVLSSMAAYAFARIKFPGRNFLFILVISVFMVPSQVFLIPNFLLINKMGLADSLGGLVLPGIFTAFGVFLLRQVFMSMPDELEEAATIDGCSQFGIYFKIMLPLAKSGLVALSICVFLWSWNDLVWPLICNHSNEKMTLSVGIASLSGQYITNFPVIMAGSVLASIPMILVFMFFQKQFVEGLTFAGIKM